MVRGLSGAAGGGGGAEKWRGWGVGGKERSVNRRGMSLTRKQAKVTRLDLHAAAETFQLTNPPTPHSHD